MKRARQVRRFWPVRPGRRRAFAGRHAVAAAILLGAAICLLAGGARGDGEAVKPSAPPSLQDTREALDTWIQTQQIIVKRSKEWEQGKGILEARLDLVRKEMATLDERVRQCEANIVEGQKRKAELVVKNDQLKAAGTQLTQAITGMEGETRRLYKSLAEPIQTKLQQLRDRMPEDPNSGRVSVAERFQNVLGILNAVNAANNDIAINVEYRNLGGGKTTQVKVIYVGLAQAYYISASGDAGIGWPTPEGWKWEPSKAIAPEVLKALEIIEGKQTAEFVPLPFKEAKLK